ncbi:MAG TPA: Pls/PosA family non-ribosomal peptide synthetase [Trebonia sp.]|nr:Pls/PosA family non-ribosomal peptide synthetase [Trebonia sp.]
MTTEQLPAGLTMASLALTSPDGFRAATAYSGAVYPAAPAPKPRTLWQVLTATAEKFPRAAAIDDGQSVLDYSSLLGWVQQVGDWLSSVGIGAGDRVGIRVSSGAAELYVSILAVLSVGAAYVPVDVDDPDDRAELVWSAAGVRGVITDSGLTLRPSAASTNRARRPVPEDDAWIIFTSGTTGTPKGVAVTHRSAAAFADAEARLFLRDDPIRPGDRVMAGLSVAFDASCEEMWLAWRHGACLVPAARSIVKTGPELAPWLVQRRISVVSTVPTLVSLWPAESLRGVRLLILGGEACPSGLADRLTADRLTTDDRRREVWNTYGPTEAAVVSCASQLSRGEPVRIGLPLAGWRLAVIDQADGEPVAWGEVGELIISGAGVARYLDLEKDAVAFRPVEALGWERAYHTGDLVRAHPDGLVFVGRADAQVKIRGYRVELGEIEAVLMRLPGVTMAAVTTYEPRPGLKELAGYYSAEARGAGLDRQDVYQHLRRHLPRHMVPAFLVELPAIPMLPSGKADRRNLPEPGSSGRLGADGPYVEPDTPAEKALADALADLLGLPQVSVDSQFFEELGLTSLMVAHFCAQVRERGDAPPVSAKDVYLHPTIRGLAAATDTNWTPSIVEPPATWRASTAQFVACGVVQLLTGLVALVASSAVLAAGYDWLSTYTSQNDLYLRSLTYGSGLFGLLCLVPIAAKWTLIGRWKPREIRVWTGPYLRFWLVKSLIQASPLVLFAGSPVYSLYLRALGARIGRGVVIQSTTVPVCTDLLTIGDDTLIRAESSFTGYRVVGGVISTGPVSIGSHALIGEHTVLDIGTSVGNGSQLGHTSALYESQAVPDRQRWHGSPAQPADVDYRRVEPLPARPLRRALYGTIQLLGLVLVGIPLVTAVAVRALRLPAVASLANLGAGGLTTASFWADGLAISAALFLGSILVGLAIVVAVPRLLRPIITPGRAYPLFGPHHAAHRVIQRLTNIPFYLELFGDSSFVTGYLQALGYRMPDFEQTGSNFGADLQHETPFLVEVGRGTTIADGATLINADYSSTSFQVTPLSVGAHNFIGNAVAYPAGGRTGENCLIATKAMVPLDGPVRAHTGLLGSPCFEIPRSATSDGRFDHLRKGRGFRHRLRAKNLHNLRTMGLFLAVRWVHTLAITVFAMVAWEFFRGSGALALAGLTVATLLFSFAYLLIVERATMRFKPLRPQYCSIYDPYFWWHERYWKLLTPFVGLFNGTPFKSLIWRLVGVRIGRQVFDDGCGIPERTLVTIGDYCTLGAGSVIQCHSMEDGIFKADYTILDDDCTIGTGAFVHYGVTIGKGARLQPDSFLMKGEKVPSRARWGGNPARPM